MINLATWHWVQAQLSAYQPDEIDLLLRRAAVARNVTLSPQARHELAQRSLGTPANVIDLLLSNPP
jgi:Holliday junction resolvasome RuvABC ATP-dependent DNA helicase subunit